MYLHIRANKRDDGLLLFTKLLSYFLINFEASNLLIV